ncbi:MAG: ABC transporter ATP-binding protein [Deltaproteobacteria bacterium]|nr:ABC transporter ATP-binding protein [Deltaproteobacteria bacterium]
MPGSCVPENPFPTSSKKKSSVLPTIHDDIAVSVRGLSKMYRLYQHPRDRLKQQLRPRKTYFREFWALRNVSFDLKRGETLGILGHNGAGKSTLLQILAGTVRPTSGQAIVRGRVAALMSIGSGFRFDFTGRENIYVLGSLLGVSKKEVNSYVPHIEAFAEIGMFLDQPVRTYSNGMLMRLAFGVYTCLAPELLIVDEVLNVGDIAFKEKCLKHIKQLLENGTSMILVSHNPVVVKNFCKSALVIEKGNLIMSGEVNTKKKKYNELVQRKVTGVTE